MIMIMEFIFRWQIKDSLILWYFVNFMNEYSWCEEKADINETKQIRFFMKNLRDFIISI